MTQEWNFNGLPKQSDEHGPMSDMKNATSSPNIKTKPNLDIRNKKKKKQKLVEDNSNKEVETDLNTKI